MSTREQRHPVSSTRNLRPRNRHLNVDLNARPPTENCEQGEIVRDIQSQIGPSVEQGSSNPPPPIDLEALDDDVVISTPRAFAEAKSKVRRPRQRAIIVDVDLSYSEGQSSRVARNKRKNGYVSQITIDGDSYINLEGNDNSVRKNVKSASPIVPMPPPKELTFTCPVCLSSIVEETSTKCGHIFCKICIKSAITAQHKCPTCRKKTSLRDIIRVFLPKSS